MEVREEIVWVFPRNRGQLETNDATSYHCWQPGNQATQANHATNTMSGWQQLVTNQLSLASNQWLKNLAGWQLLPTAGKMSLASTLNTVTVIIVHLLLKCYSGLESIKPIRKRGTHTCNMVWIFQMASGKKYKSEKLCLSGSAEGRRTFSKMTFWMLINPQKTFEHQAGPKWEQAMLPKPVRNKKVLSSRKIWISELW